MTFTIPIEIVGFLIGVGVFLMGVLFGLALKSHSTNFEPGDWQ